MLSKKENLYFLENKSLSIARSLINEIRKKCNSLHVFLKREVS